MISSTQIINAFLGGVLSPDKWGSNIGNSIVIQRSIVPIGTETIEEEGELKEVAIIEQHLQVVKGSRIFYDVTLTEEEINQAIEDMGEDYDLFLVDRTIASYTNTDDPGTGTDDPEGDDETDI